MAALMHSALRLEIKQASLRSARKSALKETQFQMTSELDNSHRHPTPPARPPCCPLGVRCVPLTPWEPRHRVLTGFSLQSGTLPWPSFGSRSLQELTFAHCLRHGVEYPRPVSKLAAPSWLVDVRQVTYYHL